MTIHREHPFVPPEPERDALRRLRGRLAAPVVVLATGEGRGRVGLTVSSLLLVDGPEPRAIALVDPDSDLGEALAPGAALTVSVLSDGDQFLAEAFAGLAPAPGGPFTLGEWADSAWGPVLVAHSWAGARVESVRELGYSQEIVAVVEHITVAAENGLTHRRGRYHAN